MLTIIQYLQQNFGLSRRKITKMINEERIKINQQKIESYRSAIVQGNCLTIDNEEHIIPRIEEKKTEIVIFHKPLGYVVSKNDPHNRTIYEILPKKYYNWWYIGRLDKNSSGLLLLTNDSRLVHEYEHPKFNLQKEYIVLLEKKLSQTDIDKVLQGVYEGGDLLETVSIQKIGKNIGTTRYKIILNQGKKRHIRRIFKALNNKVLTLQRIREGKFELGNLGVGEWREVDFL